MALQRQQGINFERIPDLFLATVLPSVPALSEVDLAGSTQEDVQHPKHFLLVVYPQQAVTS